MKEYINKFFYYFEKCKEDGIITIEELQNFDKLLEEYNNKMLELKFKQNKKSKHQVANPVIDSKFIILKEKDKKKIDKKVVNDFKIEQLKNYYEEQVKNKTRQCCKCGLKQNAESGSKNYEKDLNERYEISVNKSLINILNNASAPII